MLTALAFYGLGALITICALMVILLKNPVSAAVFLICHLFLLAGIYALIGAEFVAAIQIIVYSGAILVLFLFVIMILNLSPKDNHDKPPLLLSVTLLSLSIVSVLFLVYTTQKDTFGDLIPSFDQDNTLDLGIALFNSYLWPFEWASILILLAIVASVRIAKKKPKGDS